MSRESPPPLESQRAYRYLLVLEAVLTVVVLSLTVARAVGFP